MVCNTSIKMYITSIKSHISSNYQSLWTLLPYSPFLRLTYQIAETVLGLIGFERLSKRVGTILLKVSWFFHPVLQF